MRRGRPPRARRAAALASAALLAACGRGSEPPAGAEPPPRGWYYGTTDEEYGPRGWLVRIDAARREGDAYGAPGAQSLCGLEVSPEGRVRWSVAGAHGQAVFEGRAAGGGLAGTLSVPAGGPGAPPVRRALRFASVDVEAAPAGVFSSMRVHDETGDLLGHEVLLFRAAGALRGIWVQAEGDAGPPRDLAELAPAGGGLRFRGPGGAYDVRVRPGALVLRGPEWTDSARIPRTGSVAQYFARAGRAACGP